MTLEASTPIKPPLFENIPAQLTERPQWVAWRREVRDGTPTKVPYTLGTLRRASPTDLMTWKTFEEAMAAYERAEPPYDGTGFAFCSADHPILGSKHSSSPLPQSPSRVYSAARGGAGVGQIGGEHAAYTTSRPRPTTSRRAFGATPGVRVHRVWIAWLSRATIRLCNSGAISAWICTARTRSTP